MGMILYHGEPNGPSLVALATVFETGLDVELRPINLLAGDRHHLGELTEKLALDMGIEGEGPVLVIDGEALTDSVFIAQYLDEISGGHLQPKDPFAHWEMLMMCRRIIERISPATAFLGCMAHAHRELAVLSQADFDNRVTAIISTDLKQRWQEVRDGDFADDQIVDSRTKLSNSIAAMEDMFADGRDWHMDAFSILDLVAFGWHAAASDLIPDVLTDKPKTRAWMDRVKTRPSVQSALALSTVANPFLSWAPGPEINRWG